MSLDLLAEFEKRVSTKKLSFRKTLQGHHSTLILITGKCIFE